VNLKKLLLPLRLVRELHRYVKRLENHFAGLRRDTLLAEGKYQDPLSLPAYGYRIYSQNEEDGMIQEIFKRIGVTNKQFIEFGVGDGLENNTLALLFQGWSGLWIEGNSDYVKKICQGLPQTISSGQLKVVNSFITRDNINELITSNTDGSEIDLLSVDIDGNDAHVLSAIQNTTSRVIIIEYNSKFPPPISYCMKYDVNHVWKLDDSYGASLSYLVELLAERGYSLVGCSLAGVNAFFVRNDLVGDKFQAPFTAEQHYEPARSEFSQPANGHPASYAALENNDIRMKDGRPSFNYYKGK